MRMLADSWSSQVAHVSNEVQGQDSSEKRHSLADSHDSDIQLKVKFAEL